MPERPRTGLLFVISAPSGAGKTTLCREVMRRVPDLRLSVSYTTRQPRTGEVEGRDYWFVTESVFQRMIQEGAFVEWARVHGHLYGTAREDLQHLMAAGTDVLLDIDTQGARQIRQSVPGGVFIFVLPPSWDVLQKRLRGRNADQEEEIQRRLARAREEIAEYRQYDYVIINEDLEDAVRDLESILFAERCRRERYAPEWIEALFLTHPKEVP